MFPKTKKVATRSSKTKSGAKRRGQKQQTDPNNLDRKKLSIGCRYEKKK
jgi:hypothetical protein